MADITVKFDAGQMGSTGASGDSSSSQYLANILEKLNTSIGQLNTNIGKQKENGFAPLTNAVEKLTNGLSRLSTKAEQSQKPPFSPYDLPNRGGPGGMPSGSTWQPREGERLSISPGLEKIGMSFAKATMYSLGSAITKYFNIEAQTTMTQAVATGQFMAAGVMGQSAEAFSSFIGSSYDAEKNRIQQERILPYEAAGNFIGTALGGIVGGRYGAEAGGYVGDLLGKGLGQYLSANANAMTERQMDKAKAQAQLRADIAQSEWGGGIGRFAFDMAPSNLADDIPGLAGIKINTSPELEKMYGKSDYKSQIINQVIPNISVNPRDRAKAGDLDQTVKYFLKAGVSMADLGKATQLSTMAMMLGAKTSTDFAKNLYELNTRFGNTFDLNTAQNSLLLQMMGYGKDRANQIAVQQKYNPLAASGVANYEDMSLQEYYSKKALSKFVGFDLLESQRTGTFVGSDKIKNEYQRDISTYLATGKMSQRIINTKAAQIDLSQIEAWVAGQPKFYQQTKADKAKQAAQDKLDAPGVAAQKALDALMDNVKNVGINSSNVIISAGNVKLTSMKSFNDETLAAIKEISSMHNGAPAANNTNNSATRGNG